MAKKETFWIPYADLMTVLMVIFLFISLAYMGLVQFQQQQQSKILDDYKNGKEQLYKELKQEFNADFEQWQVQLGRDLSVRFTNPQILFDYNSAILTPRFKNILDDFFPRYLKIITQEKYKSRIAEVRIEGHTARSDTYKHSIELSQERANSVLFYSIQNNYFLQLPNTTKKQVEFWLTSSGWAYGRALDDSGDYVINSGKRMSEASRRVEFRIVTTSEKLVEELNEMNL